MAEVFKTFAIALDTKVASYVKIPVIEGDTGNRFVITLTDDGTAVDLSTSRVTAVFSGAMGTAMQDSWSGSDGQLVISGASHNIVTFDLLNGSFANGLNKCELQIYSGATYTTLITSASFNFDAKKPILNDDTIAATSEYPILVSLIDQVEALADREQSDWDETNDTLGKFIKNKPVIGTDIQAPTETLTAETTLSDADTVPFYDASATAHRKSTWANIIAKIRTALFGSVTGIAKLDGAGNVSAAAANTDFAAATHASRHASGAADAVTPAAIGAAASTHKSNHAYGGSDVLAPADIGQYGVAALDSASRVPVRSICSNIITKTASHTLELTDVGKLVLMNVSTANNLTVPPSTDVAFQGADEIEVCQYGAGQTTIVAGSGVTIYSLDSALKIAGRYGSVTLKKMSNSSENWIAIGALST